MFRGSKAGTLPSSTLIVRPIGDIALGPKGLMVQGGSRLKLALDHLWTSAPDQIPTPTSTFYCRRTKHHRCYLRLNIGIIANRPSSQEASRSFTDIPYVTAYFSIIRVSREGSCLGGVTRVLGRLSFKIMAFQHSALPVRTFIQEDWSRSLMAILGYRGCDL